MCGFWWARRAWRVAVGTPDRLTNSTGSPLSAAQPAAGIAYAGSVPEAITTLMLVRPSAALTKRSIAAARAYGSCPPIVAVRSPLTEATSPILMTWAPAAEPAPVGASSFRASLLAEGRLDESESNIGARIGGAISTDAAI